MPTIQFELNQVLLQEANEILAARQKALVVHHTKDIDASGDEVEILVRDFVRRRLPVAYYTGHGHIVDSRLNYNGQHDLIIADNAVSFIYTLYLNVRPVLKPGQLLSKCTRAWPNSSASH